MKNRVLSLAAVWLALIALVFVYTDPEEYTWRFDQTDLEQILVSEETAQAAQDAADARMDEERAEARERAEHGQWGKEDLYGDFSASLPAMDDETGLNLMWGRYDVTVSYASPEAFALRVVSAGRQTFVEDGETSAAAGEGTVQFRFALTDAAEHVRLACALPEGASVTQVVFHKVGAGVFSRDLAAYALLAGVVLSVLLVLSWDRSREGAARRRDALVLVGAALFASMPLLWNGLYEGHDLFFHLNRIEGIASGLRAGQFPVRIHASTLLGYGYGAPQFYPELFLYIPAVMRNLGVSLAGCVRVFEIGINLMTALVCYESARRVLGSRRVALGASVLYTLCIYRLVNLYTRATLGESLAMIFFPLLILAMVEVLARDERRWPLLALAMTGIFMSHLLSTMFATLFCALAAVLCLSRLIREPRRILACAKAAAVTALCSLWFLIPMLDYTADGISTSVVLNAAEYVLHLGSYLVGFSGEMSSSAQIEEDFAYTIGVVPGLAILLGCVLLLVRRYARGKSEEQPERLSLFFLGMGALALLGATEFFPWEWVCGLRRPFSTVFMQMQFPWRLVSIAAPLLSMAAAQGYLGEERHRSAGFALLTALCVIFGGYTLQCVVQQGTVLDQEGFCDSRIAQYEYTYVGTEKSALEPGNIVAGGSEDFAVTDYVKRGTNLSFTISVTGGCNYIEVPLLYYPGYRAELDGIACRVSPGTNNVLRVYGSPQGERAQVRIWFEAPAKWLAAQAAGTAGFVLLGILLVRMRGRNKA